MEIKKIAIAKACGLGGKGKKSLSYLRNHTGDWHISIQTQCDICSSSFQTCSHIFDWKGRPLSWKRIHRYLRYWSRSCQWLQAEDSNACACTHLNPQHAMLKHMQPLGLENWLSGAHVTSSGSILDFYQAHAQLFSLQVHITVPVSPWRRFLAIMSLSILALPPTCVS